MASYSAVRVKSQTLSAATVDTVTLSGAAGSVEVYNRSTSDTISFTTDGSTPTALGDDCYVAGAGQSVTVPAATSATKLISAGTPAYTVTGIANSVMSPSVNGYTVS